MKISNSNEDLTTGTDKTGSSSTAVVEVAANNSVVAENMNSSNVFSQIKKDGVILSALNEIL